METPMSRRIEPEVFRKQARLVGLVGLAGDVIVALVFIALHPIGQIASYVLAAILVASGLVLAYVFGVVFPRRYELNYARMYEPKLK